MGWHGPRDGYRTIAAAIADNFNAAHIQATHERGPGLAWVLLSGEATKDGQPLIVCVLLDGGLVKLMDTTSGPFYYGCPIEWLEAAPERGGYDPKWREGNRAAADGRRYIGEGVFAPASGVSGDD